MNGNIPKIVYHDNGTYEIFDENNEKIELPVKTVTAIGSIVDVFVADIKDTDDLDSKDDYYVEMAFGKLKKDKK
ncbi:MAG: hypothetical protein ACRCVG_04415 [Methanobacteriaceae archaeon]